MLISPPGKSQRHTFSPQHLAHETLTLAVTANQYSPALPRTGQGPWQCPQSTAGLVWRSWAQDMAHTMEAAICLSPLPAQPCASATEHEDLPEFRKGSLRRSETLLYPTSPLELLGPQGTSFLLCLGQVMQGHHTALTRHVWLKADTVKLLKCKISTFLALDSNIAAALCLIQRHRQVQGYDRRTHLLTEPARATCSRAVLKQNKKIKAEVVGFGPKHTLFSAHGWRVNRKVNNICS